MKYIYQFVEQQLYHPDIGNYTSYGIVLQNPPMQIDNVSCDKAFVQNLVKLLNEGQAHPVHLMDIIEDFLP